ncbi:MAG: iron-sulfur cluster assembly scaffold protein [Woeseiaceae bacterium]
MSADPYSAAVRELFRNAAHGGDLPDAAVVDLAGAGMHLQLAARHADGHIEALRFRAYACPHVIAACEAFCRGWEGRPVTDLGRFTATGIIDDLSVPVEKTGRILVLEDAVRALGRSIGGATAL